MLIILHIGVHKTGTSAIQEFLYNNAALLRAQGILYPSSGRFHINHNPLAWPYMDSVFLPDRSKPFYSDFDLPSASVMWQGVRSEAQQEDIDRILLSAEDFCLVQDPCLLRECLGNAEVRIIVYLRRQDHLLLSIYNEDVKNAVFARVEEFAQFQRANRLAPLLDYAALLDKWEQAFSRNSIQVGVYEGQLASHDLLKDFAQRIGLRWRDDFWLPTARSNPRIGPMALELKRRFNHRKPSFRQNDILLDVLSRLHQDSPIDSDECLFPAQDRHAFLKSFEAGNKIVAERYLGQHDATLFHELPPDPTIPSEDPGTPVPSEHALWVATAEVVQHLVSALAELKAEPDHIQADSAQAVLPNCIAAEDNAEEKAKLFQSGVPYRKNALTTSARGLLKVPETAQDNANLYSMANVAPIYMPLLQAMSPRRIVEIGSEKGGNTELLAKCSNQIGATLDVVDPVALPDDVLCFGNHVHFHQMTSAVYLEAAEPSNVYFIDGDHNYQTVATELAFIEAARGKATMEPPMLIFMDDVGWPWGRRDLFYDVNRATMHAESHRTNAGPVPWSTQLHRLGFAAGYAAIGEQEAGKKTGVLSALEDFLTMHPGWRCLTMPIFYGLAILWRPNSMPEEANRYLERLSASTSMFEPILGTLEWNRLLLYIDRDYAGQLWEHQQHHIISQARELEHAGKIWKEQQAEIRRLNTELCNVERSTTQQDSQMLKEQTEIIQSMTARLQEAAASWQVQRTAQSLCEQETTRLRNELAGVYASTSWLITKPLRILKNAFLQRHQ